LGIATRRVASGCLAMLLIAAGAETAAEVAACIDADGRLTYTQFNCPGGTERTAAAEGEGGLTIIRTAPLDDAERARLARLERRLVADRDRRARTRRQAAARQQAERSASRERCEAARRELAALRETRRRGYSAAEDHRYDAEEARWKAVRRADC